MLRVGDEFDGGRYRVVSQLGKGTFGRVVEMVDTATGRPVAVKVVRAIDKYAREAEIECEILQRVLSSLPRADGFPIVTLHRSFECRGHYCLVFDKLGPSLYHALKARKRTESVPRDGDPRGRYFTLRQIAHFALLLRGALPPPRLAPHAHRPQAREHPLRRASGARGRAPRVGRRDADRLWRRDVGGGPPLVRRVHPPVPAAGGDARPRLGPRGRLLGDGMHPRRAVSRHPRNSLGAQLFAAQFFGAQFPDVSAQLSDASPPFVVADIRARCSSPPTTRSSISR